MLHFSCPKCRKRMKADVSGVGRMTRCLECQAPFTIPKTEGELVPYSGPPLVVEADFPIVAVEPASFDYEIAAFEQQALRHKRASLLVALMIPLAVMLGIGVFGLAYWKSHKSIKVTENKPPTNSNRDRRPPVDNGDAAPDINEPEPPAPQPFSRPLPTINPSRPAPNPPINPDNRPSGNGFLAPEGNGGGDDNDDDANKRFRGNWSNNPPKIEGVDKATAAIIAGAIKDLESRTVTDKLRGAEVLAKLGRFGDPASRALCQALLFSNSKVNEAVCDALQRVNPDLFRIVMALQDKNAGTQLQGVRDISKLGGKGSAAVPVLIALKQAAEEHAVGKSNRKGVQNLPARGSTDRQFSSEIVIALANIGRDEAALSELFSSWLFRHPYEEVRAIIAANLPAMKNGATPHAVALLVRCVQIDSDEGVQIAAIRSLGGLGDAARESEKLLRKLLRSKSAAIREEAEQALNKVAELTPR